MSKRIRGTPRRLQKKITECKFLASLILRYCGQTGYTALEFRRYDEDMLDQVLSDMLSCSPPRVIAAFYAPVYRVRFSEVLS